jgi:acyl dehydratase
VTDVQRITTWEGTTAIGTTAAFIQASRRLLGCPAPDVEAGTSLADWVAIHRFVEATGDDNPLFLDANYGAGSAHASMLAPPTFVLAIHVPESAGALEQGPYWFLDLLTSMELTWADHVRPGDRIDSDLRIVEVGAGPAWRDRPTAQVVSEAAYARANRVVARARGTVTLYPLDRGRERFIERGIYRYSEEEIQALVEQLDDPPARRGGVPRFWEDVTIGESLPALVKGPLTLSDLITWVVAEAKPVRLGNLVHKELADKPGRAWTNPSTRWPTWDSRQVREDLHSCAEAGFPAPPGRGAMRVALAGQLVTHWMGDDAFLRRLAVDLPRPFIYGDTLTLTGTVRDKFTQTLDEKRYYAVELAILGHNQLEEVVVDGTAIVFLPRSGEPVLVPLPAGC